MGGAFALIKRVERAREGVRRKLEEREKERNQSRWIEPYKWIKERWLLERKKWCDSRHVPPSLQGGPCQSTDFFVYTKIQIKILNIYIYIYLYTHSESVSSGRSWVTCCLGRWCVRVWERVWTSLLVISERMVIFFFFSFFLFFILNRLIFTTIFC